MKTLYTSETPKLIGKDVTLQGWVWTIRDHKKVVFIDLTDRSGIVQVVGGPDLAKLSVEDVIEVKGLVKKRPDHLTNDKIPTGAIEIEAHDIKVLSRSEPLPFDISKDEIDVTLPTLLDFRSLSLRHPKVRSIFQIQEVIIDAFRRGLKERGFVEFQSPVIISQTAEGGAEVFEVKYFNYKAFLAQSPQFYKQIMVGVFEKVFAVGDVFRAEKHSTSRHVNEYTSLDIEYGFIKDHTDIMALETRLLDYVFKYIGDTCPKELKTMDIELPEIP